VTAAFADLTWPVRTARLVLRPTVPRDAEAIHAYRSRPDVVRYLGHEPLDLDGVRQRLADHAARTELPVLDLSVLDAASGTLVGDAVLGLRHAGARPSRRAEVLRTEAWIGYCVAPAWAGRGLATEVATALLEIAFAGLGLRRVVANAYTEHRASCRVLEKVGLRREATLRQVVLTEDGRWLDDNAYAILRSEWQDRSGHR
jgi:RimJ/RimL family protein N-acetyltransferase